MSPYQQEVLAVIRRIAERGKRLAEDGDSSPDYWADIFIHILDELRRLTDDQSAGRSFKPRTELQEHCELSCFGSDPARLIGIPQGNERSLKNLEKNSRALKAKAKKAQT